jgi:DNA sulfur modification protein DndC
MSEKAVPFNGRSLGEEVEILTQEIQSIYLADDSPWIIGYSGGKDSTAVLQLVWLAVAGLPAQQRKKIIHVISTDTLVENPIVAAWVTQSHEVLKTASSEKGLPFLPHRLVPRLEDSFWVNLIGKGYPAPRHKFRWCTERLKIKPSNTFITDIVSDSGEAILVLGTRKAESATRAATMLKHEKGRVRDRLSPNSSLPGCLVYSPIETWSNDDVWMFLMQVPNPWGYNNKDLLTMYSGASADGECPLVVDGSTPSCGDSRFGCWVCTLVEKDKSMTAMIQNDAEKEWMLPLLELRNQLDFRLMNAGSEEETSDRHLRDFRRMGGNVQLFHDRPIPGPYIQEAREQWLQKLLKAETWIKANGPASVKDITLITIDELQEIRRIWVIEKHELEDRLPAIYVEATGREYPGRQLDDNLVLGEEEMTILREVCADDSMHYELTRELLSTERQQRVNTRRSQLFDKLEKAIQKHYYESPEEAAELARDRARRRDSVQAPNTVRKAS